MEQNKELEERLDSAGFYEETSTSSEVSSKYPLDAVLWAGSTPCCKEVVIAKSAEYGRMLFTDGELQSTEGDEEPKFKRIQGFPVRKTGKKDGLGMGSKHLQGILSPLSHVLRTVDKSNYMQTL